MKNLELEEILTTKKKIREMTHELRDWLSIDKERILLLYDYIREKIKERKERNKGEEEDERNEELSFDFSFTLFCACGDSIGRSTSHLIKERNWNGILKILLNQIKRYSTIISIEKYYSALVKVIFLLFILFLFFF